MDEADLQAICEQRDFVRLLTIAPETAPSGAIRRLRRSGVVVFAGHSAATHDHMREAESQGLCGATHLFNAMSPNKRSRSGGGRQHAGLGRVDGRHHCRRRSRAPGQLKAGGPHDG